MDDMNKFLESITALKEFGLINGGFVTKKDIDEAFPNLEKEKYQFIEDYLKQNNIGVGEPLKDSEILSSDDSKYLNMYLDDLNEIEITDDSTKRALLMGALNNDRSAKTRLFNCYLQNVVDIAKLYTGQGALIEDLIGEGNVALTIAIDMLECVDSPEDADALIVKQIMNSMEELIGIESQQNESEKKVVELTNKVLEKARELAEELGRKVTVKELADNTDLSQKKITEAVLMSESILDYVEKAVSEGN